MPVESLLLAVGGGLVVRLIRRRLYDSPADECVLPLHFAMPMLEAPPVMGEDGSSRIHPEIYPLGMRGTAFWISYTIGAISCLCLLRALAILCGPAKSTFAAYHVTSRMPSHVMELSRIQHPLEFHKTRAQLVTSLSSKRALQHWTDQLVVRALCHPNTSTACVVVNGVVD